MLFVKYLKFLRITANTDKLTPTGALTASLGTILTVAGIDQTTTDAAVQAENFHSK